MFIKECSCGWKNCMPGWYSNVSTCKTANSKRRNHMRDTAYLVCVKARLDSSNRDSSNKRLNCTRYFTSYMGVVMMRILCLSSLVFVHCPSLWAFPQVTTVLTCQKFSAASWDSIHAPEQRPKPQRTFDYSFAFSPLLILESLLLHTFPLHHFTPGDNLCVRKASHCCFCCCCCWLPLKESHICEPERTKRISRKNSSPEGMYCLTKRFAADCWLRPSRSHILASQKEGQKKRNPRRNSSPEGMCVAWPRDLQLIEMALQMLQQRIPLPPCALGDHLDEWPPVWLPSTRFHQEAPSRVHTTASCWELELESCLRLQMQPEASLETRAVALCSCKAFLAHQRQ